MKNIFKEIGAILLIVLFLLLCFSSKWFNPSTKFDEELIEEENIENSNSDENVEENDDSSINVNKKSISYDFDSYISDPDKLLSDSDWYMQETSIIGTFINNTLPYTMKNADENGNIILSYPVIKYDTKEVNELNLYFKEKIDKNIIDLNNHVDYDDLSGSCITVHMEKINKDITFDHFIYYDYKIIENDSHITIFEFEIAETTCASGFVNIKNVFIVDKITKKVIYQDDIKTRINNNFINNITNSLKQGLESKLDELYFNNTFNDVLEKINNNNYYIYCNHNNEVVITLTTIPGNGNAHYLLSDIDNKIIFSNYDAKNNEN